MQRGQIVKIERLAQIFFHSHTSGSGIGHCNKLLPINKSPLGHFTAPSGLHGQESEWRLVNQWQIANVRNAISLLLAQLCERISADTKPSRRSKWQRKYVFVQNLETLLSLALYFWTTAPKTPQQTRPIIFQSSGFWYTSVSCKVGWFC